MDKCHSNVDFLSNSSDDINPESIYDSFPDAHNFDDKDGIDVVDLIPSEYAVVIYYLTTSQFLIDYIDRQKQKLAHKAQSYTMIKNVLYKQNKDGILRCYIYPS